ncbi:MAG: hypothetical protein ACREOC_04425 [Gemmatimonadales bacterium]
MTSTALALFTGAFAVLFAPPLAAQDDSQATRGLLGRGTASIQLTASPPADEPAADPAPAKRALLGQRSGIRLRLEPDDRPGRDPDPAIRGLLGR